MPKFTALIQCSVVDGLAQTLRSARIASETLVIHPSDAAIERLCLRYGARDNIHVPGVTAGAYATDAFHDWLLLLHPGEELSKEALGALGKWRQQPRDETSGYLIRAGAGGTPQLRLVNRTRVEWIGEEPHVEGHAEVFPGLIAHGTSLRAA